jgi:stage V sporulation protein R
MTMQALVIAHAAFGHNHFFKNNYLFQQWTNAEGILDYLAFAKRYIAACEERTGARGRIGARFRACADGPGRVPLSPSAEAVEGASFEKRRRERMEYEEEAYNDLWRTLPAGIEPPGAPPTPRSGSGATRDEAAGGEPSLFPRESIRPRCKPWQRELLRIVRNLAQYFYPQRQTKVMNEGCATFVHYTIMNRLYDKGLITESSLLEFLHSHTSVVFQPEFDDRRYYGINPYALGFGMMADIKRICTAPTPRTATGFRNRGCGRLDGGAEGRLGQLPRRKLHRAVPEPEADARFPPVRAHDKADEGAYKVSRSTTKRAIAACARRSRANTTSVRRMPTSRLPAPTSTATANCFSSTACTAAFLCTCRRRELVCAHIERLWGHEVQETWP